MGYQVLARKYRPQRFSDVAGQDHVTRTLTNALSQQRIAHGYIFSGHRGIGKTTIARILAMALDCRSEVGSAARPTVEPCLECVSCREISSAGADGQFTQSFDFIEIDAASNRGIDDVRSICSQATVRPARDRYKIFLLDEAHQITDAAFNAILKTLEEPPEWAIFMMATTEPENIPQTIRSRCQHFSFHAVKFEDILAQLRWIAEREGVEVEEEALALLAEAGDGSMRDALSIMDQAIASAPLVEGRAVLGAALIRELMGALPSAVFERLLDQVSAGQSAELMTELDRLLTSGNSPIAIARQLVRYLRNCLMARLDGEHTGLLQIAAEERARAARTAKLFSEEELTRNLQIMLRTFDDLGFRQEQRFHLELGLLKLVHAQRLLPMEEILSGLAGRPGSVASNAGSGAGSRVGSMPGGSARPLSQPANSANSTSVTTARAGSVAAGSGHAAPGAASAAAPSISPFAVSSSAVSSSAVSSARFQPEATLAGPQSVAHTAVEGALARVAEAEQSLAPLRRSAAVAEFEEAEAEMERGTLRSIHAVGTPAVEIPAASSLTEGEERAESEASGISGSLDAARDAVVRALTEGGHTTAATLLDAANWSLDGNSLRIQVPVKPTMIRITFNAAAEKLIRQGLAQAAVPARFLIVPGDSAVAANVRGSASRAGSAGTIDPQARNHPLVVKSIELFDAEICSVIDLRPK